MTTADSVESRLLQALDALPAWLHEHILRVCDGAEALARRYGVDVQRARIAALGHDIVRHESEASLLELAGRYAIAPDPVERFEPILLHGPIAARILVRDYALDDAEIIAGIDSHTTGRAGMTPVEQVLFVADKVEPHKLARRPALQDVIDLAQTSLDRAVLRYLDLITGDAIAKGWPVHPRTVEARNALVLEELPAETA